MHQLPPRKQENSLTQSTSIFSSLESVYSSLDIIHTQSVASGIIPIHCSSFVRYYHRNKNPQVDSQQRISPYNSRNWGA